MSSQRDCDDVYAPAPAVPVSEPEPGLVGLDELMDGPAAQYVPKHRRSVFRDRLHWRKKTT